MSAIDDNNNNNNNSNNNINNVEQNDGKIAEKNTPDISKMFKFEPEKVLVFDVFGPMAHFRNIQTNSSSLTYYFPPPTAIQGMIAAILGYERDSYYEVMSPKNIFIAIAVLNKVRKISQTLNYKVYDQGNYTQIPLEIVIPKDKEQFNITYRIYFSIKDNEIYDKLKSTLQNNYIYYPIYLGTAQFIAWYKYIGEFNITKVENKPDKPIRIYSTINGIELNHLTLDTINAFYLEIMRKYFNKGRVRGGLINIIYSPYNQEIEFKKDPISLYSLKMNGEDIFISRIV